MFLSAYSVSFIHWVTQCAASPSCCGYAIASAHQRSDDAFPRVHTHTARDALTVEAHRSCKNRRDERLCRNPVSDKRALKNTPACPQTVHKAQQNGRSTHRHSGRSNTEADNVQPSARDGGITCCHISRHGTAQTHRITETFDVMDLERREYCAVDSFENFNITQHDKL